MLEYRIRLFNIYIVTVIVTTRKILYRRLQYYYLKDKCAEARGSYQ